VPPLLLTNEEAVAIAVALGVASASTPVAGLADASTAALAKLEQLVPAIRRGTIRAFRAATVTPGSPGEEAVDPDLLARLALAVRDHRRVRISYRAADSTESSRRVEPHALAPIGKRWYLVGWDLERDDWRSFRMDRINRMDELRAGFLPRALPPGDLAAWITRQGKQAELHRATITINAPFDTVTGYLGSYARNLTAGSGATTIWEIEADHIHTLVAALMWLPWSYRITGDAALAETMEQLSHRWRSAHVEVLDANPAAAGGDLRS
jgi:predicted DNA-binding transcriptional regulator YafY